MLSKKAYYLKLLGIAQWKPKTNFRLLVLYNNKLSIEEAALLKAILAAMNIEENKACEPTHILALGVKANNEYQATYINSYSLQELLENPLYKKDLYLQLQKLF